MAKWRPPKVPEKLRQPNFLLSEGVRPDEKEGKVVEVCSSFDLDFDESRESMGRWRYEKEKGGWQFLGGPYLEFKTNKEAVIADIYGNNPRGLKKVPVPRRLLNREHNERYRHNLFDLEGEWHWDEETQIEWTWEAEKGGWFVSHNDKENAPKTKEELAAEPPKDVSNTELLERIDRGFSETQSMLRDQFIYTMLSKDNRVLKIGWTRKYKEAVVVEKLKKRYDNSSKAIEDLGGPFAYIIHERGTEDKEGDAHDYLQKTCGIEPLWKREYYPAQAAIKALQDYRIWPLGHLEGFIPEVKEEPPEQPELFPPTE